MQELEAKFLIQPGTDPDDALRRLQQSLVWGGFRVRPQSQRRLTDTYYDTPDQRLRAAGWSYRLRDDTSGREVALKALTGGRGAVFDRTEIEQILWNGEHDLARLPEGPVRDRLEGLLQPGVEVLPLFSIRNRRVVYALTHPDHSDGRIELAYDRVVVDAGERITFDELEFEHREGSADLLAAVLATASLEPELFPARLSKFQRGLIALDASFGPGRSDAEPQPDMLWRDVAAAGLKRELTALKRFEPYAWEGLHAEGVHGMRVATRRLRGLVALITDLLPEGVADAVSAELRALAHALGDVRDIDVQQQLASGYAEALTDLEPGALARYRQHLTDRHRRARQALQETLERGLYPALLHTLRELPARIEGHDGRRLADAAPAALAPAVAELLRRGRAIDSDSTAERLHRVRRRAKRLRDQLQSVAPAFGDAADPALGALRRLAKRIGEHQDAWVARACLKRFRATLGGRKREDRALRRLIAHEKQRAERAREHFARDWERVEAALKTLPSPE